MRLGWTRKALLACFNARLPHLCGSSSECVSVAALDPSTLTCIKVRATHLDMFWCCCRAKAEAT